jgi:hypothetical protein
MTSKRQDRKPPLADTDNLVPSEVLERKRAQRAARKGTILDGASTDGTPAGNSFNFTCVAGVPDRH